MTVPIVDLTLVLLSVVYICGYCYRIFIRKSVRLSFEGVGLLCLSGTVLAEILPTYVGGRGAGTGIFIRVGLLAHVFCLGIQHLKKGNFTKKRDKELISQLNPHFIFNTLGAIRIVTKTNADLAYDMLYDFSKCLRAMLRPFFSQENISFREEAAHIISYSNLERIRFGDNIIVRMEIAEEDFKLPPLSVQPLVENAIRYGLRRGRKKGVVTVRSYQTLSAYIVQVEDDGVGFDASRYNKMCGNNSLEAGGLQRVRHRVEHMAGGRMDIKSFEGIGTVVTLRIPKREEKERHD